MFQDPSSSKGATSNVDTSKKRALEVLEQDNVVSLSQFETTKCLSGKQRSSIMYLYAKMLCLTVVLEIINLSYLYYLDNSY